MEAHVDGEVAVDAINCRMLLPAYNAADLADTGPDGWLLPGWQFQLLLRKQQASSPSHTTLSVTADCLSTS